MLLLGINNMYITIFKLEDDEDTSSGIFTWLIQSGKEEYRFAHFDILQRNAFARGACKY